eukprot:PhM_4_TR12046/c0_g1_i1/m.59882/K03350/APC3, CDC27; anaphase-promoting complex subunit 3
MDSSGSELIGSLRHAVKHSLDLNLFENAIFLAERLFAESSTLEHLLLVATCYFRSGDIGTTYRLLRHHHPFENDHSTGHSNHHRIALYDCMYLFGTCQTRLQRWVEAERTFIDLLSYRSDTHVATLVAGVHYQLAQCYKSLGKKTNAIEAFRNCLAKDATLITAYESAVSTYHLPEGVSPYESGANTTSLRAAPATPAKAPTSAVSSTSTLRRANSALSTPKRTTTVTTASTNMRHAHTPHQQQQQHPMMSSSSAQHGVIPSASHFTTGPFESLPAVLRSFLRSFATAMRLLWTYSCDGAVEVLTSTEFPFKQTSTGWFLTALGRAHYEMAQYVDATQNWLALHRREPWRVTPTLVQYSTALWHLGREKELSLLAQQLIEAEPHSAITLCVTGNLYSLVKEQRMAIKMFHRATLVDRSFAYAHILKGYEHLSADEAAEADQCFHTAVRLEPRNYLAISGLGEVLCKHGHIVPAKQHFQQALEINPFPPLFARLACVYVDEKSSDSLKHAVQLLDNALRRDPNHLMARHRRAEVYLKLGQYKNALSDLEFLRTKCPREAAVHIALARGHRKLGNKQQALHFYNQAVDLDDQWASVAKAEIENLTSEIQVDTSQPR